MNLIRPLLIGGIIGLLFGWAVEARGQVCECLNCPLTLPPSGLDTCYYREFILNIKGASNDDLADPFQGICALNVHFQHNYVWSLEMYLISPGGDTLALTGPAMTSGYASSALSSWNIQFLPSVYPANPDAGFQDKWSNDQLWEVFRNYTGQYYPSGGDLDDIDTGPVNGQWKILVKNCTEIESGQFLNFSLVFCDETGIDCSCQAYGGSLTEQGPWWICAGDSLLDLELQPFYLAGPPDSTLYDYTFMVAYEGIFQAYVDSVNLTGAQTGTWDVCGLSFALADQDSLLQPDGNLTIPLIRDSLFSAQPPFCGDLSGNCLRIHIGTPLPVQILDTTVCEGQCVMLGATSYCSTTQVRDTFPAFNGCDSIVELRLVVTPAVHVQIKDTICQDEFVFIGTNSYNKTGVYTQTLTNPANGCDSVVVLDLVVLAFNAQAVAPGTIDCYTPVLGLNGLGSTYQGATPDIWWQTPPGVSLLSGQQDLLAFTEHPGLYALILSKTLTNGKTCSDTAFVNVAGNPARPDLKGPANMPVCTGFPIAVSQLPVIDSSFLGGQYRYYSALPFETTNQVNGFITPQTGDSLFVFYQVGACVDTFLTYFHEVPAPYGILPSQISICNESLGGTYNTWINFDTLLLDANVIGSWSNTDNAPVGGAFPLVNFQNVPGPDSYTFTWTSVNAQAPCANIQESVQIFVENCACPSVATLPPGPFCETDASVWLPDLQNTSEPGNWSVVQIPSGTNPAMVEGDSLVITGRDTGLYRIVFRLDTSPPPGCPDTSAHDFVIHGIPTAILPAVDTVCNDPGSGLWPTIRYLDQLILEGDTGGIWLPLSLPPSFLTGDTVSFVGLSPGEYAFQYTTQAAEIPCPESQYLLMVTVLDCVCPPLQVQETDTLCSDIEAKPLGAYQQSGGTGIWSILSAPPGGNPASISSSNVLITDPADPGLYLLGFTLSDSPGGACVTRDTLSLLLVAGVDARVPPADTVCNQGGSLVYPVQLDFSTLLTGVDTAGQWISLDNPGAQGSLPFLDFTGVQPGHYEFLFLTQSAMPPCLDRYLPLTITVRDCQCPGFQDTIRCTDNGTLDLNELHDYPGLVSWTVTGVPTGASTPALNGSLFAPPGVPGVYVLRATWQNGPEKVCPDSASISVEWVHADPLEVRPVIRVCNQDSPFGPGMLWLDSLITSGAGTGLWTDLDNSGAAGTLPWLDFTGVLPGVYRFLYVRQATGPCPARQDTVLVRVDECLCPDLLLQAGTAGCNRNDLFQLGPLAQGLPPGSWTVWQAPPGLNPAQVNGSELWIQQADPGHYYLLYTLQDPVAGCPDTAGTVFVLDAGLEAGMAPDTLHVCQGDDVQVQLDAWLTGAQSGGFWTQDSTGGNWLPGLAPQTGLWIASKLAVPAGAYPVYYIHLNQGACPADTARLMVDVVGLPDPVAGPDTVLDCLYPEVILGMPGAPVGWPLVHTWFLGGQPVSNQPVVTATLPGMYVWEIRHEIWGCARRDTVMVAEGVPPPTSISYSITPPNCLSSDGTLDITNVLGGLGPFMFRLQQGAFQVDNRFDSLAPGSYLLEVEDARGCRLDTLFDLEALAPFSVMLGPDLVVAPGAMVNLKATLNGMPVMPATVTWLPFGIQCLSCLEQSFAIDQDVQAIILIEDGTGCIAADSVWITVFGEAARFYIPSAFSPNGDGVNDRFVLFGNDAVVRVNDMRIYDRWGNLLYELPILIPGDLTTGWDGTSGGHPLDPGVYIYTMTIEWADGRNQILKGEVILLK